MNSLTLYEGWSASFMFNMHIEEKEENREKEENQENEENGRVEKVSSHHMFYLKIFEDLLDN